MPNYKKAAIYDPYLDTLGGGERYCLTVAEILLKNNYKVDLIWSGNPNLKNMAEKRFSLDLKDLKTVPDVFNISPQNLNLIEDNPSLYGIFNHLTKEHQKFIQKIHSFVKKIKITRSYDLFFFLSDGSIPFLFSRKNILHVQVPFVKNKSDLFTILSNKFKLSFINKIVCNSEFTQKFANLMYCDNTTVIYPPVDISKFSSQKKENIILSVGRFDNILNAKKQDVLIETFKKLSKSLKTKWKLVLAGGSLQDASKNNYLSVLKKYAQNYPIEFFVNLDFDSLADLYNRSKIYWHAAGFEVDEDHYPQNTEHFGITIVESMSTGAVPVVIAKGGLPEIVKDNVNGFLWTNKEELISKTKKIIDDDNLFSRLSQNAISSSKKFSKENFKTELLSKLSL